LMQLLSKPELSNKLNMLDKMALNEVIKNQKVWNFIKKTFDTMRANDFQFEPIFSVKPSQH